MVYTLPNKSELPTINQVLTMVRDIVSRMPIRHRMPYDVEIDGEELFLLNRTNSGLFTLKPNITNQPCLFYGDNEYHVPLRPRWSRENVMVENVIREEFELVMESHPLYRLFIQGIPTSRRPIRIINPFGNAMAYGFPSPMLKLTSSLDVAAFFATHSQNEATGEWTAIAETDGRGEVNVGVLYVMELAFPFPMIPGLSCIGMQAFERPGAQKMYAQVVGANEDFNRNGLVTGFQFRQRPDDVKELEHRLEMGSLLTPNELIATKAREILTTRRVSTAAFERNLANNPKDNPTVNRQRLTAAGVEIVEDAGHLFTEEELEREFYPRAIERWEEMFSHVVALHPGFDTLLADLRNYPNTDSGRRFFRR